MGKYYYLVAGLANLSLDESRPQMTLDSFREQICPELSRTDAKLMELPLLESDCRNLAAILQGRQIPADSHIGTMSVEQLQELTALIKKEETPSFEAPSFIMDFLKGLQQSDVSGKSIEDALLSSFYNYAISCRNTFVSSWYSFNLDLNNVQTALISRKYGLNTDSGVVGDNETARQLRSSGARDWGLQGQLDFFDELVRLQDEQDLSKREYQIDMLRWKWLEDNSFFHYFTVEYLFSYMERLVIACRWSSLDHDNGEKLLRSLISELKGQVSVPSDIMN